jgi:BirA family biotin operon repressor/biotin-[acetyl-CoA-carboxylase] ligase
LNTSLLKKTHPELTIDWVDEIDSTQSKVKLNGLLIAEYQTAGVGRRGNSWLTVNGKSICFSLKLNLATAIVNLSGYALTVALAVLKTTLFYDKHNQTRLKWPNDLYVNNSKFGGILINLTPRDKQNTDVTVGVGINWELSNQQLNSIDQPVTNIPITNKPSRAEFINQLILEIKNNNQQFLNNGLVSFLPIWQQYDYFSGKQIIIKQNEQSIQGSYQGIDSKGQLKAMFDNQLKSFAAAEVSIRNHV